MLNKCLFSCTFLIMFLLCACNENVNEGIDGKTSIDEIIDYSSFSAHISDSFTKRDISNRAINSQYLEHIGFRTNDYPDLSVMYDSGDCCHYSYNINNKKYEINSTEEINGKPIYIFNSNDSDDGATVGAIWPSEFLAKQSEPIELKNLKSRISISYKYKITDKNDSISEMKISLGKVINEGYFETGRTNEFLQLLPQKDADNVDLSTTQVMNADDIFNNKTENKNDFIYGTYETFIISQQLKAYNNYIKFNYKRNGIESENIFYFKNSMTIEPNNLYSLVFNIEKMDNSNKLNFEIVKQNVVAEWEVDQNRIMDIDPNNPILSQWDGKTVEDFTVGDGSVENPYQIKNANNMAFLCLQSKNKIAKYMNANYKLMINIDWQKSSWTPIGQDGNSKFTGVFDGNGKIIKNVIIIHQWNNMGIFGCIKGEVKNLNVRADIKSTPLDGWPGIGSSYGGICGTMFPHSLIENCSFSGNVSANYYVGGIAGISWGGSIKGCVVKNSKITSFYNENNPYCEKFRGCTGGIIGFLTNSDGIGAVVSYCLVENTTLDGCSTATSGIIGDFGNWSTINYCCAKDNINQCPSNCGGVIQPHNWINKKYNFHNSLQATDVDYYKDFNLLDNKTLANILNGMNEDVEFIPDEETDWYWKSVNNQFPVPTKYINLK